MFISIQSALTQCSGEATSATRISASIRLKVSVLVKVVFVQIVESESIGPSKSCFQSRMASFQNELSNVGYKFHNFLSRNKTFEFESDIISTLNQ